MELSRLGSTLQRYARLSSRPSVSFAQDSPDSPLPPHSFLSQLQLSSEQGALSVCCSSEAEWNRLGTTAAGWKGGAM